MPEDRQRRVHLRTDQTCGKVGCCDSSPNRHAAEDGHPIARSIEPGEEWSWCYRDEQLLGKLAAKLAPPEPQLQHAALRLGVRG